jgi:hypothetical protein
LPLRFGSRWRLPTLAMFGIAMANSHAKSTLKATRQRIEHNVQMGLVQFDIACGFLE